MSNLTRAPLIALLFSFYSIQNSNAESGGGVLFANLDESPQRERISYEIKDASLILTIRKANGPSNEIEIGKNAALGIGLCSTDNLIISLVPIIAPKKASNPSPSGLFSSIKTEYPNSSLKKLGKVGLFALKIDDQACDSIYVTWHPSIKKFALSRSN